MAEPEEGQEVVAVAPSDAMALTLAPLRERIGLRVDGEVDAANCDLFEQALAPLAEPGCDVHLELGQLRFIDVAGTATIVALARRVTPGRVVLHDPPCVLVRVLQVLWPTVSGVDVR